MNFLQRAKSHCIATGLFLAVLAITVAGTAIPAQAQTYKVVYNFGSNANDPVTPAVGPNFIAQGRDGNLYSMSWEGGNDGRGAAFKIVPSRGTLTVLANFVISNGDYPIGGLTLGTDGNFYGTTNQGGDPNCNLGLGCGTVMKITSAGALTTIFAFPADNSNGSYPGAAPIEGTDGNFYGTTADGLSGSTLYKMTPAGTVTLLHQFDNTDGNDVVAGLVQGTDGDLYGGSFSGGTSGDGVLFKVTPGGVFTVLHNFVGTDGISAWGLIQATDGNFYGATSGGGTSKAGVVFKITPGGTYTVLHNLNGTTDGLSPYSSLIQATDGNFYGVAASGGTSGFGTIYKVTPKGVYSVVHNFDNTTGSTPESTLTQRTNGLLYGDTNRGGSGTENCNGTCGVFYSLNIGAAQFVRLVSTSGKVGSKVGILGQAFSSSSVVKFNGVQATTVTRNGTTFLLATVPAGASNGKVTVTTGSTELTSSQTFIVHNSWGSGAAIPTAVFNPSTAVLNNEVYLVGGNTTTQTAAVQIYNPVTNSWSAGVSLPIATANAPAAVVDGVLYLIGGYTTAVTNAVWAYDPKTKTWSGKAAMPTARDGAVAVVENNIIYVAGGYNGSTFIATVESYNPATDTWKKESPMLGSKDLPVAGLIGSTIVAADGANIPGQITGDTEGYNATTNSWTTLATDPTARTGACGAVISSRLYDAGGYINNGGAATTVNESFNLSTNTWTTTLAPMPLGTLFSGSAVHNGQLYCFGGESTWTGNAINNVQIYQP